MRCLHGFLMLYIDGVVLEVNFRVLGKGPELRIMTGFR